MGVRAPHSCAVLSAQGPEPGLAPGAAPPRPSAPALPLPSLGQPRPVRGTEPPGLHWGSEGAHSDAWPCKAKDLCGCHEPSCHLEGAVAWRQQGICPGHLCGQVGSGTCCRSRRPDSQSVSWVEAAGPDLPRALTAPGWRAAFLRPCGGRCWGRAPCDGQPWASVWPVVALEGFSGHLCP